MQQLDEKTFKKLEKQFKEIGEEALTMNHYELASISIGVTPNEWKMFLMDPRTVDYVSTEMNIIRSAAMNNIVRNAGDSHSVGQSQLLNALQKIEEGKTNKEGPVFIYCYVPLNDEQKKAPNVRKFDDTRISLSDEGEWIMEVNDEEN